MKTTLKVVIWALYICALPVLVVFSIGMLTWSLIGTYKDWGKVTFTDVKDCVKALFEGYKEGHKYNMLAVEHIDD